MIKGILILFGFLLYGSSVPAQDEEKEASLKAVFIYNFTKYIDWDTNSVDREFVIGVMGQSAITPSLLEIARTRTAKNRRIVVRIFNKPEELGKCHILFIPRYYRHPLSSIIAQAGRGVLTICEEPGYAKLGAGLNFTIINDKLKFEANLAAIYAAGLRVSSQLLKLAIIVDH